MKMDGSEHRACTKNTAVENPETENRRTRRIQRTGGEPGTGKTGARGMCEKSIEPQSGSRSARATKDTNSDKRRLYERPQFAAENANATQPRKLSRELCHLTVSENCAAQKIHSYFFRGAFLCCFYSKLPPLILCPSGGSNMLNY